jgi:hypothetical protein
VPTAIQGGTIYPRSARPVYCGPGKFWAGLGDQLAAYAEKHFWLQGFDKGSEVNRLAHFKQVEKTTGKAPQPLQDLPRLPDEMAYIWQLFGELKTPGVDITFGEIRDYCKLTGECLTAFDVRMLRRLDQIYKAEFHV